MYEASKAFHEAVATNKPQKALLIFDDCVFTDEDINVENGIEFRDYFNLEEDIAIGQTLSNEISFSLFNDDRLLNDYTFGDFLATIGVLVGTDVYQERGTVTITTNYGVWDGTENFPYVKRNNAALRVQPNFAVKSLLGYDGKVWAFSDNGRFAVYDDRTGDNVTSQYSLNKFMKKKTARWSGKGIYYNKDSRILFIYEGGKRERYEFVPLGWFIAERPKAPDRIQIDMNCNDLMVKFDKDMPTDDALGISYPITFENLLKKMCNYVGVQCAASGFINSTARVKKRLEAFDSVTVREVVQWIAEAAGSNAKINRDGKLVLDWLRTTAQSLSAGNYSTFDPYWYETKKITKLCNRKSDGSFENNTGAGEETYLIQDNPLLEGVS